MEVLEHSPIVSMENYRFKTGGEVGGRDESCKWLLLSVKACKGLLVAIEAWKGLLVAVEAGEQAGKATVVVEYCFEYYIKLYAP